VSEIESVKPAISVIIDDGDFIINSTGPLGKAMSQAILPLAAGARKVTIINDGEMKVMKRNGKAENKAITQALADVVGKLPPAMRAERAAWEDRMMGKSDGPDIQDQYAADLEAGITGEQATGEVPTPTPGPSDPVKIPARRKPQIFQDAAAPPAPELAEAEMAQLLEEAAQAERESSKLAEDRRFQAQQAVQAGAEATDVAEAKPSPRKREPRNLATTGKSCGRCGGGGQVMGDAGFTGACPVCMGAGQVKAWDRGPKFR